MRFNEALALGYNNANVYYSRAAAFLYMGSYLEAVEDLDKAIEIDPNSTEALGMRAGIFMQLNIGILALSDMRRVREIDPSNKVNLVNLISLHSVLDDPFGTIDLANTYIKDNPNEILTLSNRASAYVQIGQYERAIRDYDRLLEVKPDNLRIFLSRARAKGQQGDLESALEDIRVARAEHPDNYMPVLFQGIVFAEARRAEDALEAFYEARELALKSKPGEVARIDDSIRDSETRLKMLEGIDLEAQTTRERIMKSCALISVAVGPEASERLAEMIRLLKEIRRDEPDFEKMEPDDQRLFVEAMVSIPSAALEGNHYEILRDALSFYAEDKALAELMGPAYGFYLGTLRSHEASLEVAPEKASALKDQAFDLLLANLTKELKSDNYLRRVGHVFFASLHSDARWEQVIQKMKDLTSASHDLSDELLRRERAEFYAQHALSASQSNDVPKAKELISKALSYDDANH
ncbi:MAG: tetratricopeptide repeat protein, partial [Planctomycetes bacterium]|nr:tetratricopeptide repeat protein [Planctomycetota bacterium]